MTFDGQHDAGEVVAQAHSNIALCKYWGKRDAALNLPAVGSISITLAALTTRTRVRFDAHLERDTLTLDGQPAPEAARTRVQRFLDLVREPGHLTHHAAVVSDNNFPTGAGLASSASAYAALALAASRAAGLTLSLAELSALARRGSGSAARSIFGGYVEMPLGDTDDAAARPLAAAAHWPLTVHVAITSSVAKATGSTSGMNESAATSPYYDNWVESSDNDLRALRAAVLARDFERLAAITEHSCLKMHAVMLATRPALVYWRGATVELMHCVRALRARGTPVCFTIDAGPQLKAITLPSHAEAVLRELAAVPGVLRIITSELGGGAVLV
ncbi:MAG: diphosphomevalonate decarboxylase [Myxococcota bacterium]